MVEMEEASKEVNFGNGSAYTNEKPKDPHHQKIPLVLKLQHYPHISSKHVKNALLKHWNIIEERPDLKKIFPDTPIIAHSRAQNLSDILVKAV